MTQWYVLWFLLDLGVFVYLQVSEKCYCFRLKVPIECFEQPWVIFRGEDGKPGCVRNTCAHRACPLDLGTVNEGRIQCPYHG